VVAWGINAEFAAILFVGGVLSIGLGGVINALENMPAPRIEMPAYAVPAPAAAIPEFGRRAAEPAAAAAAAAVAEDVSPPVRETIAALEQARQKIEQAFEPKPPPAEAPEAAPEPEPVQGPALAPEAVAEPEPEPEPELPAEAGEVLEEGQLYVVEERFIRQRPARILSDGTVEAETDEGWMRFENLEHLDEYLDAMAQSNG
jgi:outer membrane biosynthesis protein TonB